jgi:hypothetical protein
MSVIQFRRKSSLDLSNLYLHLLSAVLEEKLGIPTSPRERESQLLAHIARANLNTEPSSPAEVRSRHKEKPAGGWVLRASLGPQRPVQVGPGRARLGSA